MPCDAPFLYGAATLVAVAAGVWLARLQRSVLARALAARVDELEQKLQ